MESQVFPSYFTNNMNIEKKIESVRLYNEHTDFIRKST